MERIRKLETYSSRSLKLKTESTKSQSDVSVIRETKIARAYSRIFSHKLVKVFLCSFKLKCQCCFTEDSLL